MAWLFKQPESDFYWIGYRTAGKQIRRSTGTANRAEAQQQLETLNLMTQAQKAGRLTDEFYRTLTGQQVTSKTLKAAVDSWHEANKTGNARKTKQRYNEVTSQFLTYMHATDAKPMLSEITHTHITGFLNHLSKTLSVGSVRLSRKILSMFFNWTVNTKEGTTNPVRGTKPPKGDKADAVERRCFTIDEWKAMAAKAPDAFWRFMLTGGLYTGLRLGDLVCLRKKEVNLAGNVLEVTTRKTGTPVRIPIAATLRAILTPLVQRSQNYLWPDHAKLYLKKGAGAFSNEFHNIMSDAGLVPKRKRSHAASKDGNGRNGRRTQSEISYHCLRHTFVTMLKLSGASGVVAKELAAHAGDDVSALYTHVPEELMQQAIRSLPEITIEVEA